MRRLNILMFLCLLTVAVNAQFINNGAVVTIQSGATLRVETDIQNNGTGIINNSGTIEVQGHLTNAATATFASGSGLVKFIGTTNSNVDMGGDALHNVEMAKTTATGSVTLTSPTSMGGDLSFTGTGNNKIILGANDLTMTNASANVTATTNHATNGWVVSDKTGANTGRFVKAIATGMSSKTIEIGDDINYSPITMDVDASSPGTVGTRVITDAGTLTAKYAETTDYINREWVVATTNVTSNSLEGTYVGGDAVGNPAMIKGATHYSGDWHFNGSAGAANSVTATTTESNVRFSGKNFFGKVNVRAFLQGPYNASTGLMTTTLNSTTPANNVLENNALTSPYLDAPATVNSGFFLANPDIVDWVKLELRDPSSPSSSTSHKSSAFIKNNGDVVGLDGTSYARVKNGFSTSVIVLSHRNHLSIRTIDAGTDVVNPITQLTFNTNMSNVYNNTNPPFNANTPMKVITGTFATNAMWAGDTNSNGTVLYNGLNNDRGIILSLVGSSTPSSPFPSSGLGYRLEDVNLNGVVLYNGLNNDRGVILSNVGSSTPSNPIRSHL